ncbi:hypothetical protein [Paracoccus sp. IB05]|uniref:hypothetical protein n=1 Tax=Paracoccus sp. IB05 TaxID=2779367 RepID=UPI0018E89A14|nr:hypothetical protein [Paracoccus sp. IB05]MBJ2151027.1 hypothetical protein [Paracoccus sp. IB05]
MVRPQPTAPAPAPAAAANVVVPARIPPAPAVLPPRMPAVAPAQPIRPSGPVFNALPTASRSRLRRRHIALMGSFVLLVLLPVLVAAWYLWARAADQYSSMLGFSVHREDGGSTLGLLAGISSFTSTGSTPDTDIIYNYIFSQQVVAEIQNEINLVGIWSKPSGDPWYTYDPSGSIEDLLDYWKRMVSVYYDSSTRLMEIRVLAFDPDDAQHIAQAIYEKSGVMINRLNEIANEDAVAYSRKEMEETREKLVVARQEMTAFRNKYQIVDPTLDLQSQSTILNALEQELAQSLIDYDLLSGTTPESDPRVKVLDRRITVIRDRIAAERSKIGAIGGENGESMADVVAEYERLTVDREFAEASHTAARAAYEAARVQATRQSRYLAAHVLPTRAETSRFPEREKKLATVAVFLIMLWGVLVLVFYSLRDRR